MPPLAGKPPFGTDEPESFYESAPHPQLRLRQPPPPDPNARTSAYNLYDSYLGDDKNQPQPPSTGPNRNSGVGALGMGLLNMDDSDSEDEDEVARHKPVSPPGISASASKHAALAAATTPVRPNFPPIQQPPATQMAQVPQPMHGSPPSTQPQARSPVMPLQPQLNRPPPLNLHPGQPRSPQPIAAPRPGYAAPIAALNLARPELAASPVGRMPNPNLPQPHGQNPFEPPYARSQYTASPAPSTPHPLHPSMTPITPAFIRPSNSPAPHAVNVKFSEGEAIPRKPIMRGNSEETLLPGRGEKGDDFWRRFSMVAKEGNGKSAKESSWLHQTRNGSNKFSRTVWVMAIFILILIAGGVVLGLFMRRNAPSHQQPKAFGGSADSLATSTSVSPTVPGAGTGVPSQTSLHVSPTLTLHNREEPTMAPSKHYKMQAARRLNNLN